MRGHRSVCLSDFQGVGIGHALITYLGSMWKGLGYRVFRNTGHPAEIAAAKRAAEWMMTREPGRTGRLLKHMAKSFQAIPNGRRRFAFEHGDVLSDEDFESSITPTAKENSER
jgi:hypothetical protein